MLMDAPAQRAQPIVGVALKITSTIVFTLMATLVKLASADYPIGEIVFFRSFFALVPVLLWVAARGQFPAALYTSRFHRHLFRSVVGAAGMYTGFTALALLPIADATAIGYAAPLMTVVLAVIFLGEKVRIYRWTAVAVGFIGVLVILSDYVGPEASGAKQATTLGAIIAVASAFIGASASTQVRAMVHTEAPSTIVIYFSLFCAAAGLFAAPFAPWSMPGPLDAAMLVGAGILGGIGQVTMTQSFRHADASLIAPFDYTSMIWALIVSLLVFNTWPSGIMLVGTAIVVGAGLFVIYREHRLGIQRNRSKQAQTPTTPLT
jgi:drug/metabolite transporter (DMT)-like permease